MPVVAHVDLNAEGELALLQDEVIRIVQPNVTQHSPFAEGDCTGVLVVTNMRVAWYNKESTSGGSSYNFRDISMHAISSTSFDKPCLYCHLDTDDVTEIRFVPEDSTQLQAIYDAFCQGAIDNPDLDEEEPCDAWISSALEDEDCFIPGNFEHTEEGQFDE